MQCNSDSRFPLFLQEVVRVLSEGSFSRSQLEVLDKAELGGLYSPPLLPLILRGGWNSTPDSKEWGGGGTLSGRLQDIRSGILVRGPPILYISALRALNCPGSCQNAIKDQPRTDYISEQMLATSQEFRADL